MENPTHYRWYHTWWGVTLLSLIVCLVIGLAFFVGTTIKYWWQIAHGETPAVVQESASNFTVSGNGGRGKVDRAFLETIDSPWLGRFNAPVTIVEFFDLKCPNCKIEAPILHQLDARYHDKVRIIVRHFPPSDPNFHPGAVELSHLAYCAYKLNPQSFWAIYDLLYQQQDTLPIPLDDASISNLTAQAGLDMAKIKSCMLEPSTEAAVNKDYLAGVSAGVRGTPTFFVNGEKVEGAITFEMWKQFLDQQ